MPSNSTNEYGQLLNPQSYVAHGDVTNLGGNFLTKGSINVLIRKGPTEKTGKVITRGGTSLVGALKTVDNGITRSTDWDNSTGDKLSLRVNFNSLTVFYNNQWQQIYSGFGGRCLLEFVPWYNATEQRDTLLFALGDTKIREWSGGIATIASATTNTLTKTGYATSTTYTFDAPTNTITDSSGSFASAAFAAGDNLVVSGSASNDGIYQISSIAGNVITIAQANALTTEAAGATVIIKLTKGGSWQDARFLTSATLGAKQVTINGVVFTYTGGETTGTLTGVTPDPTVSSPVVVAGNTAFQTVRVHTVSDNGGVRSDIKFDYVGVYTNYIFYGSKTSRVVLMSKSTDFTSCGFSTPRLPTEGAEIDLDSNTTGFAATEANMWISAGPDYWYKISFTQTTTSTGVGSTLVTEAINTTPLKISPGEAAIAQSAIFPIKNGVSFLSYEGIIEDLANVQVIPRPRAFPISDDIKDDLDSYDRTDAHGIYFKRNLFVMLPKEGVLLIRDMIFGFWQPPQLVPFSRLAIIRINGVDTFCGHSAVCDETYAINLYDGKHGNRRDGFNPASTADDNGAPIEFLAAFGYENFGSHFWRKVCDKAASEIYISINTILTDRLVYNYQGATAIREFGIDGSKAQGKYMAQSSASLGQNVLGYFPLGNTPGDDSNVAKVYCIWGTPNKAFFERQRIFKSDKIDDYWEILAYGENISMSEDIPVDIIR